MERLAVNLNLGQVRRETINGREYLVAPATLINPGVLPGSQGPLYYPPSQCARNVAAWNKVPLVLYHPSDPLTNSPIPANSDGVLDRQGLGFMRRTAFNGKLQAETCFDVERTRAADARYGTDVLQRLKRNQRIELSTGLYTDNVPAPQGYRDHNGNLYRGLVATNYRPDHVAILPDQVGACSVDNGCGVLVNSNPEGVNQYTIHGNPARGATTVKHGEEEIGHTSQLGARKWRATYRGRVVTQAAGNHGLAVEAIKAAHGRSKTTNAADPQYLTAALSYCPT